MFNENRFKNYKLAQPHDESIISRNKTIEAINPTWIEYRKEITDAWQEYQNILDNAMIRRNKGLNEK